MQNIYQSKVHPLPGTEYKEIHPAARRLYNKIRAKTKRKPYVRSKYFDGEKVFLETFWGQRRTEVER